jgi:hypothetical protein
MKTYLSKQRTMHFACQPVGLIKDFKYDLWLHLNFDYDSKRTEVICDKWTLTNSTGDDIPLTKLNYYQVQFVAEAMAEELKYHTRLHYEDLEMEYHEGQAAYWKLDRLEDEAS